MHWIKHRNSLQNEGIWLKAPSRPRAVLCLGVHGEGRPPTGNNFQLLEMQ